MNKKEIEKLFDEKFENLYQWIEFTKEYDYVSPEIKDFVFKTIIPEVLKSVFATIYIHTEKEGGYCDTGEDMDWYCRSECVELAKERFIEKVKELFDIDLQTKTYL